MTSPEELGPEELGPEVVDAEELATVSWDVVVVGTGMGGGTIGYELARLGRRVLFLEKGSATAGIAGLYPEETFDLGRISDAEHDDHLARAGRNTEWYRDTTPGARPKPFRPIVGSGVGGSSALYGMVTERFFREDFEPRANFRDVGDSTVPESWPVKYAEMAPWYRKAEQLYRVRGTADPIRPDDDTDALRPPAPMTSSNSEVAGFLTERGMHPYNLHVACEYTDECKACQAFLCAAGCKNHAGNICVEPALRDHGAVVLDRTTVVRLESTRTRVTGVVARHEGRTLRFTGKVIVLAASALQTPVILLNSGSTDWPNGLANTNDLVGRNLMRHFIDTYLFRIRGREAVAGQTKEISVNDLYLADGDKFGTLQSMGHVPPYEFLMNTSRRSRSLLGSTRWVADRHWKTALQDRTVVMATITEDLPYLRNRILPGPGSTGGTGPVLELQYTISEADQRRHQEFGRRMRAVFGRYPGSPIRPIHLSGAKMNSALGHQCGTCRFGDDPKTSVLDPDNRAWGLDNLYVVDTSMLPSSAGINPSLTVAANALRVGNLIHGSL